MNNAEEYEATKKENRMLREQVRTLGAEAIAMRDQQKTSDVLNQHIDVLWHHINCMKKEIERFQDE